MPRPESQEDLLLSEKRVLLASFDVDAITHDPEMLRIYAALTDAVRKRKGDLEGSPYVQMYLPKSEDALVRALEVKQRQWDNTQDRYLAIADAERNDTLADLQPEYRSYEATGLRIFADKEGLPQLDITSPANSEGT